MKSTGRMDRRLLALTLGMLGILAGLSLAYAQQEAMAQVDKPGTSTRGSVPNDGDDGKPEQSKQSQPLAPVGSGFTYQGQLKDGGNPANGQYDLQFNLYDADTGGAQVGTTVELLNQAVSDGLFTVQLDFGAGAFQGEERWLEIAVKQAGGGSYTTLSPRQKVAAAPYAMSLMPGAVISGTSTSDILTANNLGTGSGLLGTTSAGSSYLGGVTGISTGVDGNGVIGIANNGAQAWGVGGFSTLGVGVAGWSTSITATTIGVYGRSDSGGGFGVYGYNSGNSIDAKGVVGRSDSGYGVLGRTSTGYGVYGWSTSNGVGVIGESTNGNGGIFTSTVGTGLKGTSAGGTGNGVYGVNTSSTGYGVLGENNTDSVMARGVVGLSNSGVGTYGLSNTGYGVVGQSNSITATTIGVYGISVSGGGVGVYGVNNANNINAKGVIGRSDNGVGVYGDSINGIAIFSAGNAKQYLGSGGWVKAMVRMGSFTISRCYNSQSTVPDITPPCGFVLSGSGGNYTITFPFTVNDRFVSVTPDWGGAGPVIPVVDFPSSTQIRVRTYNGGSLFVDSAFFLVIY